ncbi:MAG: hypothetical protein ACI3ZB_09575, partial [Prevotella sp.]
SRGYADDELEIDEIIITKYQIMKKKLYQQPSIKVHEVPKDALLAAGSGGSNMTNVNFKNADEGNPTRSDSFEGPIINSKRGNLWGDDEQ